MVADAGGLVGDSFWHPAAQRQAKAMLHSRTNVRLNIPYPLPAIPNPLL
jgi:hypothetical protein